MQHQKSLAYLVLTATLLSVSGCASLHFPWKDHTHATSTTENRPMHYHPLNRHTETLPHTQVLQAPDQNDGVPVQNLMAE